MLNQKKHNGFTLIEVIIATAILVMVGVAAVAVEINFMGSATTNKHRLQATALAQEGINAARAIFTSHLLLDTNPALLSGAGKVFYLNPSDNTIVECNDTPNNNCTNKDPLKPWNITQNNTTFTRTITIPGP